jgi:hypothetical protein
MCHLLGLATSIMHRRLSRESCNNIFLRTLKSLQGAVVLALPVWAVLHTGPSKGRYLYLLTAGLAAQLF